MNISIITLTRYITITNTVVQETLADATDQWGVKVERVEMLVFFKVIVRRTTYVVLY